ncbi:MAG: hypothetical protein R3E95_06015 [Thiolinea sp.]
MSSGLQLHVVVPALFAPLDLWRRDFGFVPDAPALLRLLAVHQYQSLAVQGLERTLLERLGGAVETQVPWAGLRHALESGGMYQPPLLCADPVSLLTGQDSVTLQPQAVHLERTAAEELITDLNTHLASDGLTLKAFHPTRWYLHATPEFARAVPQTTPPSEVGNRNIFPYLPQSADRYWPRLLNELQMLLHTHPVNQAREQRGESPVNSLWLGGEGAVDALDLQPVAGIQGGDLRGQVLARAAGCVWQAEPVMDLDALEGEHLVILDALVYPALTDQPQQWQAALDGLAEYFEFLRAVLQAGEQVTL